MKIVPSIRVAEAFQKLGALEDQLHPRDENVALLAREGVAEFGRRFAVWLWENGFNTYRDEVNDCDDFALHAHSFAKQDHAQWTTVSAGLAFGEVWFIGDAGSHAINFAAHENEQGEIQICLYEPQVQWNQNGTAQVALSEVPASSVRRWLFASW